VEKEIVQHRKHDAKERLAFTEVSLSSRPQARIKCSLFFPAACTSEKTLLGPQTCATSAEGGGRVRCSGPQLSQKSGEPLFWHYFVAQVLVAAQVR
jgi:hypothetical protein